MEIVFTKNPTDFSKIGSAQKGAIMSLKQSQFAVEVEQLRKVVQENNDIAEEVSTNLDNVEQELGHMEGHMKGMKSDVLQYRYALDNMKAFSKELEIVGFYVILL